VSRPPKNRPYQHHGLNALKTALAATQRDSQQTLIDSLGETGRALREWRDAIVADLGGEDAISAQERAVIDAATTTYLMPSSVDRFLLEQPSIVNKSRRQLFPVVLERQRLADALVRTSRRSGWAGARRSRSISTATSRAVLDAVRMTRALRQRDA